MRRPRPFADRGEAGRALGASLGAYAGRDDVVVLGLPRGGVPVAAEVAAALDAPLDVLVVRKLGVPGHPELAMGAIAFDGVRVLNPDVVSSLAITDAAVDEVVAKERVELDRRRRLYRGDRAPVDLRDKVVIVVDDGLATGATMRAAVAAVRAGRPALVVVAVPVGAPQTCEELVELADDVVCVRSPENFQAVGQWYVDFSAPGDDEVRRLLGNPRTRRMQMAPEVQMGHEVQGVVAGAAGGAVTLRTVLVPDPGPGEVLVRVQACGVCHTDLHYRDGAVNDDFPFLLGHEAAGVVEATGDGVAEVSPGDFVVLAWRAPCGTCRSCRRGRPWYCFDSRNASQKMTLEDGTPLTPALGIGAFAPLTLVAAGQAVKVPPARPEAAGLIGCGVMAGIGAALHTGAVQRGDTVAVFGCGGVGDAAIAASVLAGARQVIAVDIDERKLAMASEFGATHTVRSREVDPVQAVKDLTGGLGVDVAIEAVGLPETMLQAFYARDLAGTLVQVGVPAPGMTVELPMIEFFGRGGALKPSWYGDCLPTRDFPVLIDAYLAGRLDLDGFVSETIGIDQVEEAFARMQRGDVLRSVVVF